MRKALFLVPAFLLLSFSALQAKVELPAVIGDNMVLQQNTEVALWGKAAPGRTVVIKAGWTKSKFTAVADGQTGRWSAKIQTPAAGGPYSITFSDGEKLTLENVLIGEVWFCSGQSNMEMPMNGYGSQPATGADDVIVNAKASRSIRVFNVKKCSSQTVMEDVEARWQENTPDAVAATSATAYYFADKLQAALDIPVGIIVSSWGGSTIETWVKREVIEKEFPEFSLDHLTGSMENAKKNGAPALLYNGQVAPLIPFTFKGMIWYQGESNRARADQYIRLQEAYVRMMREDFNVPDAPFYFVQIAPFPYGHPDDFLSGYFCEAQQKTLDLIPHSGMAVTCDAGEYGTIHPCRKELVGKRLAYLALKHDYGMETIVADAPKYKNVEFEDGKAYVSFEVERLGLSPMGTELSGFEIAGEDQVFHPAKAYLYKGEKVVVSSDEVEKPVAVRYCFRNWCTGSLYNNFGIPAAPFRTDDWKL